MKAVIILLPAFTAVAASPFQKRASTTAIAGATTSDIFPPTGTKVDSALFPGETAIGFPGVTKTGVEPFAIQTAAAYPNSNEAFFPLVGAKPADNNASSDFSIFKTWGNLSPWYSVNSSAYGLDNASPLVPDQCEVTQVHILYRHGARYPTSGALPSTFSAKLQQAATSGTGFNATGDLAFLNDWTYKLGAELLTPFGRLQNFELGIEARQLYGHLLNNFTEQGTLPVFRTESQDRMVKTAQNFAAGFFGVPEFLDEVSIEIVVEASGFNDTGAPYETCENSNVASRGSIGSTAATNFSKVAFAPTVSRLQPYLNGVNLTTTDIVSMIQLCSYETVALGYSQFCSLFTEDEFKDNEYYNDIAFYYNNGFGSPVSAAQGKGYLEEFVARFQHQALSAYNSTTNSALDSNSVTFPLNQSIYADATHEVVVLDVLTALNLTAIFASGPPPLDARPTQQNSFVASQVVPFATHLVIQILECSQMTPTKQARFIVNDAVLPIDKSYPGCPSNEQGLCAFDTVLSALEKRVQEIDFDYDCFGNYTATAGVDYNGRAPR